MSELGRYIQNFVLLLIVLAAAVFMINAAAGDSAIFDETAHIVAGYTYLKHLDYRFNPEHPPLVKMLAGLPLLFQHLNFSTEKNYWGGLNEQWWAGNEFLYKQGNDADQVIFWARLEPILLTLILLVAVYFIAKEVVGRLWALLPVFLLAFSPLVLAHGHLVTTDTGATLGILLAIYSFLNYLYAPSNKNLFIAGLVFGFAQAIKFSAILLIPYLFFVALIFALASKKNLLLLFFQALSIIVIGYLIIIYPLYLLTTWNYPVEKQIADTVATISDFRVQPLANLNIWMAGNKVLRPLGEYLLGILMVAQRSAGGNNAYFLGELSSHGWWYYFPLVYLMKESLPALIIVFLSGLLGLWRILISPLKKSYLKFREYLTIHFTEFSLLSFIIFYWLTSITNSLNIGVRHIIPTLPFIYILSANSIKQWFAIEQSGFPLTIEEKLTDFFHSIFNIWAKTFILIALIIWLMIETAAAAPYFLSYFNELFGGRTNGFYYATDSNFDWGQDLKQLQKWVRGNLEPKQKIAVDYFGGGDVKYYLGEQAEPWWSARGNPKEEGIEWLAISANTLQGALAKLTPGFTRNPVDEYRWLENSYNFIDRAGTSIFIYKL